MIRRALILSIPVCLGLVVQPAGAAEAPYEKELERLAEILGSLHFLRNLCGEEGTVWRDQMEKIISAENPEPRRREKLIATFNRGYRSYDSVYSKCTEAAIEAISRYMAEGKELSRNIPLQYGN